MFDSIVKDIISEALSSLRDLVNRLNPLSVTEFIDPVTGGIKTEKSAEQSSESKPDSETQTTESKQPSTEQSNK